MFLTWHYLLCVLENGGPSECCTGDTGLLISSCKRAGLAIWFSATDHRSIKSLNFRIRPFCFIFLCKITAPTYVNLFTILEYFLPVGNRMNQGHLAKQSLNHSPTWRGIN